MLARSLVAISLLASGPAFAGSCPALQPTSNRTLTFDSEFATTGTLSTTQWNSFPYEPQTINGELEAYVPSQAFMVSGTGLRLQTKKQAFWNKQYVSAEVSTRGLFAQTYGHFEVKAKVPQADGLWPAFWMLPESDAWPPEIDVLEYLYAPWGKVPTASDDSSIATGTVHWLTAAGIVEELGNWVTTPASWGSAFHIYSVEWRPNSIVWAIDGKAVYCFVDTTATGKRVPSTPMYMILDDAIGAAGSWSGTVQAKQSFPANYDIAYVRAYQFKDSPATAALPGDIRNTTLSAKTVAAGGSVKITTHLVVGNANLGPSYTYIQVKNYDGSKVVWGTAAIDETLQAGKTYTVSATYAVPATLAAGLYVVSVWTGYADWTKSFQNPEAQLLTVTN